MQVYHKKHALQTLFRSAAKSSRVHVCLYLSMEVEQLMHVWYDNNIELIKPLTLLFKRIFAKNHYFFI